MRPACAICAVLGSIDPIESECAADGKVAGPRRAGIGIASHVSFGAGAFVSNPKFGPAPSHPKGSVHGRSGGGGGVGGRYAKLPSSL